MQRKISWALLGALVLIASLWYAQAQWSYQRFIQTARGLEVQFTDTAVEETPAAVRVRFTLVLTNTSDQVIPIEGVSCLLYAGREFLGPCTILSTSPAVPARGEWRLTVTTDITGHYQENYHRARTEGIRVKGSLQMELPLGDGFVKVTRRFHQVISRS
jgi:hypothetical protein